jgi:hypothetical protein
MAGAAAGESFLSPHIPLSVCGRRWFEESSLLVTRRSSIISAAPRGQHKLTIGAGPERLGATLPARFVCVELKLPSAMRGSYIAEGCLTRMLKKYSLRSPDYEQRRATTAPGPITSSFKTQGRPPTDLALSAVTANAHNTFLISRNL